MTTCVACNTQLTGGLDTYGPPDQPMCVACYFEVNEFVEKMNEFDASSCGDPDDEGDARLMALADEIKKRAAKREMAAWLRSNATMAAEVKT